MMYRQGMYFDIPVTGRSLNVEIERKFLVKKLPDELDRYPVRHMEQSYVSVRPVIRVRLVDDKRILTVKSKGLLSRQEFEMELDENEYENLKSKSEGNVIVKDRYVIPLSDTSGTCGDSTVDSCLVIELDVFSGIFDGLIYAEVEFPSEDAANAFVAPEWFGKDVTALGVYQNSALSSMKKSDIAGFVAQAVSE